jgi:hypothetical protein
MTPPGPGPAQPPPGDASGAAAAAASRRKRGLALFLLGVVLVVAAVWTVMRQTATLQTAWESARAAPWWMIALVALLPLLNWLLSSLVFWVLTGRYGRVGLAEMAALIGSAWLLNNLPMRPGMVGRIAYHKLVNGIPVRDSIRVLVCALGCTATAAGIVLAAAALTHLTGGGAIALTGILTAVTVPLALASAATRRSAGAASMRWRLLTATALRIADVALWALRYWLVFRLIGVPIGPEAAAIVAAASQAAMVVPVQLGVREWIVGLAAAWLPPSLAGAAGPGVGVAPGLLVDLVNRAAEILVALPVGMLSGVWLAGRRRATPGLSPPSGGPPFPDK